MLTNSDVQISHTNITRICHRVGGKCN